MKKMTFQALLYAGVLLVLPNPLLAQKVEATTTTVTSSGGTISEFGAQGIVIKTEAGTTPVRYLSSETTNYVDENDNPVDVALIKSGLPATVHYSKVGDTLIASKVVVNTSGRPGVVAKTTTQMVTTPTTAGVITEFGPEGFIIKSETSPDPLRYGFSKTTTYVDESGQPVSTCRATPCN